jgi:hypothetical protein
MDSPTLKLSASELTKLALLVCKQKGIFAWRNNTMGVRTQNGGYRPVGGICGGEGSPDIIGVTPYGGFIGIEIKTLKDRISSAQETFGNRVTENKGIYLVIGSNNILQLPGILTAKMEELNA